MPRKRKECKNAALDLFLRPGLKFSVKVLVSVAGIHVFVWGRYS